MLKIYDEYQKYGIDIYYKTHSIEYYNPHEEKIKNIYRKHILNIITEHDEIVDIACGDGMITRIISEYNNNNNVDGIDPYFNNKYTQMNLSFEDIAKGELNNYDKTYDIAICSYAFHLMDKKIIYDFMSQLSMKTKRFIIITPSKKIKIIHPLWKIVKEIREDKVTIIILDVVYNLI
jgi:2-polyprenyl-3-methyl-5-hydroxy-6-metoxy-1,4-benzoquinol methylase